MFTIVIFSGENMPPKKQIQKIDFNKVFFQADWCPRLRELVKDPNKLAQFVSFVRSDAFIGAMQRTAKSSEGRKNIVEALKDETLRGILLSNFDSYTVRWAIGDLFNSIQGQLIMVDLVFRQFPPSRGSINAVTDIVKAMATTKLSKEEILRDYEHFKKKENENLHASAQDLKWLRDGFSSNAKMARFLMEIYWGKGRRRLIQLLRTQEVRPALNEMLGTAAGRSRMATLIRSDIGLSILEELMKTPEGVNVVGYLWNFNGKTMLFEHMVNLRGLGVMLQIMDYQQKYAEIEKRRGKIMGARPRPWR